MEKKNLNNTFDAYDYRRLNVLKEGTRLTNYNKNNSVLIGDIEFKFDYRRDKFDHYIPEGKLKYLGHPEVKDKVYSKLFLTNSGQAAMNSIYFYLNKIKQQNQIESHNDYLYVGAYRLQYMYNIFHTQTESKHLWICSTATKFTNSFIVGRSWETVIVDTTCWGVGAESIQKIYDHYINRCENLILFRSHSKLDMGGVEYGSLGSLIIISENKERLKKLNNEFENILGLSGGYAILDEIPPYLFREDFFKHSSERVHTIKKNCKLLKSLIKNEDIEGDLIFPDHYKYFFIKFSDKTPEQDIKRKIKRLNFIMAKDIPDVVACASFGFNFPSISFYPSDEKIGFYFRFCPGTGDEDKIKAFGAAIIKVFKC